MKDLRAPALLLLLQILLILGIVGQYGYQRHTEPRVWVRVALADPFELHPVPYPKVLLLVNACILPHTSNYFIGTEVMQAGRFTSGSWNWTVSLAVREGQLVPQAVLPPDARKPFQNLWYRNDQPCDRVSLGNEQEIFLPDRAGKTFPLKPGQELWVEVTLPPSGPPRPIQIAISSKDGFQPLRSK